MFERELECCNSFSRPHVHSGLLPDMKGYCVPTLPKPRRLERRKVICSNIQCLLCVLVYK